MVVVVVAVAVAAAAAAAQQAQRRGSHSPLAAACFRPRRQRRLRPRPAEEAGEPRRRQSVRPQMDAPECNPKGRQRAARLQRSQRRLCARKPTRPRIRRTGSTLFPRDPRGVSWSSGSLRANDFGVPQKAQAERQQIHGDTKAKISDRQLQKRKSGCRENALAIFARVRAWVFFLRWPRLSCSTRCLVISLQTPHKA